MYENNSEVFQQSPLDEVSKMYLLESVKWSKFLAILGFIACGFMLLGAIFMLSLGASLRNSLGNTAYGAGLGFGMTFIYVVLGLLYFLPIYYLYKFSVNVKAGIKTNNHNLVVEGFRYQKMMYRFIGILTLVVLCIYALIFLIGILGWFSNSVR